jgi:hypothetical protein
MRRILLSTAAGVLMLGGLAFSTAPASAAQVIVRAPVIVKQTFVQNVVVRPVIVRPVIVRRPVYAPRVIWGRDWRHRR